MDNILYRIELVKETPRLPRIHRSARGLTSWTRPSSVGLAYHSIPARDRRHYTIKKYRLVEVP